VQHTTDRAEDETGGGSPGAGVPDVGVPDVGVPDDNGRPARRWAAVRATGEAGMSTAEYAVGTVAACAFAAVLYRVVTGGSIVTGLTDLVESALATLS
jgi:hypothetical protein